MRLLTLIFAVLALWAGACRADANTQLRHSLARLLPDLPADARIVPTPYSGLFEVDAGTHLFYTDAHGSFLISGEIFDARTRTNVTQARLEQLSRIDWKQLPLQDAITIVHGNGRRQIALFEDPYCPYCRKMEQSLESLGNVTMHVFLLPVIRDDSPAMATNIWCAPDRARAWSSWMGQQKAPPKAAPGCATPLAATLALARRYDIQSTPTLVLTDGTRITGAVDATELARRLPAP